MSAGTERAEQHQDWRSIQRKRGLEKDAQKGKGWGSKGENDVTDSAEKVFFLRKSKWLRVSNVTEKSREIMT